MHNSLHIRELLARMNADPLCVERRDPHRAVARDPLAAPGAGEFALTAVWIQPAIDGAVDPLILADLADFFARMQVAVGDGTLLTVRVADDLAPRACRLRCRPEAITIEGGDLAGVWAGIAWLEWEMRTRRGPFLPVGEITRHAAWPVQISQGPWGGNYSVPDFSPEFLSDDAFRLYAHFGVNNMMIYGDLLCYTQSAILPELNFPTADANLAMLADAAQRAARYGVQFSYVVVGPKLRPEHPVFQAHPTARGSGVSFGDGAMHCLCSSDEVVLAFYREQFTRLLTAAPELGGFTFIIGGESMYHCHMWRGHGKNFTPCPRCGAEKAEVTIGNLLAEIRRAVDAVQPQAYVTAWAYNVWGWERPDREALVRALPDGVAFYHHLEKDQWLRKDGYEKHAWDYSVDFTGPSDDMRRLAPIARATGHPLFVKTETGIGLEVFQFPYVTGMQRLAEKWRQVRELRPAGVQQSWLFFGMCGSRAEELGFWAAYRDDLSADEFLRRMAVRDFGPAATDNVLASWELMSSALGHIPCLCLGPAHLALVYYIGPSFLGPAHPLVPREDDPIPEVFHGYLYYLQEMEESFSHKTIDLARQSLVMASLPSDARCLGMRWEGPGDGWDIVTREYVAAAESAETAWRLLLAAEKNTTSLIERRNLREELRLTELLYRTFLTCERTVRFLVARRDYTGGDAAQWDEMRRLALLERENALAARAIYEELPWLDLPLRIDGTFPSCLEMLAEKVRWIEEVFGVD